jgi:septation ring formation regulator EzrA
MIQEEFDDKLNHQLKFNDIVGMFHLAKNYTTSLEARIAELEAKNIMNQSSNDIYALQVNDLLKKIAELEAHIEAFQSKYDNGQLQYSKLWDMYSDLKKQLEPKSCDGCEHCYIVLDNNFQGRVCQKTELFDIEDGFYCSYCEPKW